VKNKSLHWLHVYSCDPAQLYTLASSATGKYNSDNSSSCITITVQQADTTLQSIQSLEFLRTKLRSVCAQSSVSHIDDVSRRKVSYYDSLHVYTTETVDSSIVWRMFQQPKSHKVVLLRKEGSVRSKAKLMFLGLL
jgi:hypothetical protein